MRSFPLLFTFQTREIKEYLATCSNLVENSWNNRMCKQASCPKRVRACVNETTFWTKFADHDFSNAQYIPHFTKPLQQSAQFVAAWASTKWTCQHHLALQTFTVLTWQSMSSPPSTSQRSMDILNNQTFCSCSSLLRERQMNKHFRKIQWDSERAWSAEWTRSNAQFQNGEFKNRSELEKKLEQKNVVVQYLFYRLGLLFSIYVHLPSCLQVLPVNLGRLPAPSSRTNDPAEFATNDNPCIICIYIYIRDNLHHFVWHATFAYASHAPFESIYKTRKERGETELVRKTERQSEDEEEEEEEEEEQEEEEEEQKQEQEQEEGEGEGEGEGERRRRNGTTHVGVCKWKSRKLQFCWSDSDCFKFQDSPFGSALCFGLRTSFLPEYENDTLANAMTSDMNKRYVDTDWYKNCDTLLTLLPVVSWKEWVWWVWWLSVCFQPTVWVPEMRWKFQYAQEVTGGEIFSESGNENLASKLVDGTNSNSSDTEKKRTPTKTKGPKHILRVNTFNLQLTWQGQTPSKENCRCMPLRSVLQECCKTVAKSVI